MNTTTAATTATESEASTPSIIVAVDVCHGDYRERFYGAGATVLEAAEEASLKSTYSNGLFSKTDSFYEQRAKYREDLRIALEAREPYRGFGWCDFTRVA